MNLKGNNATGGPLPPKDVRLVRGDYRRDPAHGHHGAGIVKAERNAAFSRLRLPLGLKSLSNSSF
jgi:hypothetical protein